MGYLTHSISGATEVSFLSGGLGYELAYLADGLLGWGTFLFLVLTLFIFIIYFFNVTSINAFQVKDPKPMGNEALEPTDDLIITPTYSDDRDIWPTEQPDPEPVLIVKTEEPWPFPFLTWRSSR
ncbi:MAG: hypothetical protein WDN75_11640 [Bacteroidota bacterium]